MAGTHLFAYPPFSGVEHSSAAGLLTYLLLVGGGELAVSAATPCSIGPIARSTLAGEYQPSA